MDKLILPKLDNLFRKLTAKNTNITMGYSYMTKDNIKEGKIYENGKVIIMKK